MQDANVTFLVEKEKTPKPGGFEVNSPKSVFRFYNFFAIIVAAGRANTMGHLQFVALRAFNQVRSRQFPVGTTGITTGFRHFSLRYCHFKYTSSRYNGEFNL
jgi:hypothetical protein